METKVALVSMPFLETDRPSLGLSLLKAGLAARGIPSVVYYLNILFADQIGHKIFDELNDFPEINLVKEWIFVEALWGRDDARDESYINEVLERSTWLDRSRIPNNDLPDYLHKIWFCRRQIPRFLDRCLDQIPWSEYRVIGFSSVFQQQIPSLALARLLKEKYPELVVVFGGANCEGEMGMALLKNFPFVDAVCTGEGDRVFPGFVCTIIDGRHTGSYTGMLFPKSQELPSHESMKVSDMDKLPYPNFDDFFDQRMQCSNLEAERLFLLAESSRGCWWGEKSHCTFCGLNGMTMQYRLKTAQRMINEIVWMLDRYKKYAVRELIFVDKTIPMEYMNSFLPELKKLNLDLEILYETRSNLKKSHIKLCREGGIGTIQSGIESLTPNSLKLMRKGVTAMQNIQLLKWCRQFGVHTEWFYLIGFPGERPQDYRDQSELIHALTHLQPPRPPGIFRIEFRRFSPYLANPSDFGVRNLRPHRAYKYIYPNLNAESIQDLAYYFECDFEGQELISNYAKKLQKEINGWLECCGASALFSLVKDDLLIVCDFRPGAKESIIPLSGIQRRLYEACDKIRSHLYLQKMLISESGCEINNEDLDAVLAPLINHQLLLEMDRKYLSLAIPLGSEYFPPEAVWSRLQEVLEALDDNQPD
ncbi:MAG: RiPP maturation radical SAM C-methyltransferase [Candidatus Hodarchaeota archaeon]